ncbi:ATP-binding protein [Novosphingobium sp.]|uniref:sensor histidine kinase n=1 Tax=Novosphingobium sp. TaxID=1874826 RepID=UPI00286E5140|nr:ATP-binding protein [Novosphingobium sp.]
MALALAALAALAPDPARIGLAPIAAGEIQVMEPGEQHQARHPASANWSLDFADQFRFDEETARQRAAKVGSPRVNAEERQWHFTLAAPNARAPQSSLFIADMAGEGSLYINGARTAETARNAAYYGPGIGGAALNAALPREDFQDGLNRIDIIQSDDGPRVGLRAVYVGPASLVDRAQAAFARWLDWQRLAAVTAAVSGLIAALLLSLSPQQRVLASALTVLAALQTLDVGLPAASPVLPLLKAGATVAAGGLILFVQRRPLRWEDSLLAALAGLACLGGIAAWVLASGIWLPEFPFPVLQLANTGSRPLLLIAAPVAVWRNGRVLLDRLALSRSEMERKDDIIARQQQTLDAEIRNAAILEERQRFARDMHDGIGGHLQGLLMRVRAKHIAPDDVASELQSGLADLRLMVDSLDQIDASLFTALENFRLRAGPQLDAAGIRLDWTLAESVREVILDPRAILSIYRMLQELVTNCARHSGAQTLSVTLDHDAVGGGLTATFADDGRGFDVTTRRAGKGLTNLRKRITKLNGDLSISAMTGAGTVVSLRLPIKSAIL